MTGILKGKRVAVLLGGPGSEREVSLRSGAAVARALHSLGAIVREVDVRAPTFSLPAGVELAYNMIHGTFGEDGQIQQILEQRGVPYTGEGVKGQPSCIRQDSQQNDDSTRKAFPRDDGMLSLTVKVLASRSAIRRQGSAPGIQCRRAYHQGRREPSRCALEDCFRFGEEVLVEEFFAGRELTVGILGDEALPVVEIVPREGFYDYQHKYTKGASQYFVPADIGAEATEAVQHAALSAKRALGLEVYSRVDVLLAADGRLNVLEINTIPGMTETSLLPKAAAVAGLDFPALCERIASLSLQRYPNCSLSL